MSVQVLWLFFLEKNTVLQTAIHFDEKGDKLIQEVESIIDNNNYSFQLTRKNVQSTDEIVTLFKMKSRIIFLN
jgi:hypothetical protein